MNFIEFIGFIITMVAFVLLMFKQAREARQRKNLPEEEESNENSPTEEEALQDLLQVLNIQQKPPPSIIDSPPSSRPIPFPPLEETPITPVPKTKLEKQKFIDPHQTKTPSKKDLFKGISLKNAIVLSVLLGPPKGQ